MIANSINMNFLEKNSYKSRFSLQTTFDYSRFKLLKTNRKLDDNNLKKIEYSIKKYGLLQPIIVTKKGYILDGQHRFDALKKLKMPIDYVVSYNGDNYAVIESNKIRKGWSLDDYINYWSNKEKNDYIYLKKLISQWTKYSTTGAIAYAFTRSMNPNKNIQDGTYKIDIDFGNDIMTDCLLLSSIVNKSFSPKFIRSLKIIKLRNRNFDINRLAKNCNYKMLRIYNNEADTCQNIVEVYNYKLSEKNRIN